MNKVTTVLAAGLIMAATTATDANAPPAPNIYRDGPLKAPKYAEPHLFNQERTAYSLLEAAMQVAEGLVHNVGCTHASATWKLNIDTLDDGSGNLELSSEASETMKFNLRAQNVGTYSNLRVRVTGGGYIKYGLISGLYSEAFYSNYKNYLMVQTTNYKLTTGNAINPISGTVIRNFWVEKPDVKPASCVGCNAPAIVDWGLQFLSDNQAPHDAWWHRSYAKRTDISNSVLARTMLRKDRLYSAKNGGACIIEINATGVNDADLFSQEGAMTIRPPAK